MILLFLLPVYFCTPSISIVVRNDTRQRRLAKWSSSCRTFLKCSTPSSRWRSTPASRSSSKNSQVGCRTCNRCSSLLSLGHPLARQAFEWVWTYSGVIRRVARILQRRGGFLEAWNNSKQTWPELSSVLNQIEAVFLSQSGDIQKEKKGLHQNSVTFPDQLWVSSKKKKLQ